MSSRSTTSWLAAVFSVLIVATLAACGTAPASDPATRSAGTRQFESDAGTVTIPTDPQRIVAIGLAVERTLQLGITPVGVSTTSQDPSMLRRLTPEQTTAYESAATVGLVTELDYEQIAALRPDLIIVNMPQFFWNDAEAADLLPSIAPTAFLAIDIADWQNLGERFADAVARGDAFSAQRGAFETEAAEIAAEHSDVIDDQTFAVVNQWTGGQADTYVREYADSYCTVYAEEAGIELTPPPTPLGEGATFESISLERLSDLSGFDVIIYPLDPDGTTKDEFEPILASAVWQNLAPVAAGHAVGVECSVNLGYVDGLANLESLDAALASLAR